MHEYEHMLYSACACIGEPMLKMNCPWFVSVHQQWLCQGSSAMQWRGHHDLPMSMTVHSLSGSFSANLQAVTFSQG